MNPRIQGQKRVTRRTKPFVSSLVKIVPRIKRNHNEARINQERTIVLRQLLKQGRSVVLSVSKNLAPEEEKLISALKKVKGGKLRILRLNENSIYLQNWMRDSYSTIERRVLNEIKVEDLAYRTKKERRFFGDGGRLINCGKINGKPTIIISNSAPTERITDTRKLREVLGEIDMLKKRGYTVYELPGEFYRPKGYLQGHTSLGEFFHHLDVFVNHVKGTNLLLVDSSYYYRNQSRLNDMKGLKIILVPASEKYYYPANFLNLGNKEILMDKNARKTMELLKKEGVKVYSTPVSLKANRENFGGIRCFVNEG